MLRILTYATAQAQIGSDFYDTVENWFWYMMILSIGAWVLNNVFMLARVIAALQALGMG